MLEKGILQLNEREVGWEERQVPSRVSRDEDEAFFGHFVSHPECCAHIDDPHQTFSVHISSPGDENFVRLPLPPPELKEDPKPLSPYYCPSCHSDDPGDVPDSFGEPSQGVTLPNICSTPDALGILPVNFINNLNITGRISVKARGKELIIAICNSKTRKNFVLRVNFGLEGHCFWIPTTWYKEIISAPTVPRGVKNQAFSIPNKYIDGPPKNRPGSDLRISIQAAFIRPNWTLIFVDPIATITFHLMQVSESFHPAHLEPIWSSLWSRSQGPVYSLEPAATLDALDPWRTRILTDPLNLTPIFTLMKTDQTVFNGSGAQETTDQLLLALIHPQMPAIYVCSYDEPFFVP
ncbi:hypothetical protein C8R44DRAFT_794511 [Mycena epipterygia]|nr:hypothetical protein C8R44DRAFT_794511 [Mycena epipterygia]